jgi:hypothetical protein
LFDAGGNALFTARSCSGTPDSPGAVTANQALFTVSSQGYDGSAYSNAGTFGFRSTDAWTGTDHGSQFTLALVQSGTTTLTTVLTIDGEQLATFTGPVALPNIGINATPD